MSQAMFEGIDWALVARDLRSALHNKNQEYEKLRMQRDELVAALRSFAVKRSDGYCWCMPGPIPGDHSRSCSEVRSLLAKVEKEVR